MSQEKWGSADAYKKAAELNDISSQYNLGLMYKRGLGIPVDKEKANFWLKRAAENGHPHANDELS